MRIKGERESREKKWKEGGNENGEWGRKKKWRVRSKGKKRKKGRREKIRIKGEK